MTLVTNNNASRKEQILAVTARLCARHGMSETNLRQVAREAGVSAGTLHYHFPSKVGMLDALVLSAVEPMGRQAREIAGDDRQPKQQIEAITEMAFRLFDEDWDRYYVGLLLGDDVRSRHRDEFPSMTQALVEVVRRGQSKSLVRDGDPNMLGILCHGMLLRVPRGVTFGELERPISQYASSVSEACWSLLRPAPT